MDVRKSPHGKNWIGAKSAAAVVVVVIIIAAAFFLNSGAHARTISSSTPFVLRTGGTAYFSISGQKQAFSIFLKNASESGAEVYMSGYPVLEWPILEVYLTKAEEANVSLWNTGPADLQIKLVSSNATGASLIMTPVPATFSIKPSPGIKAVNPSQLYGQNAAQQTTISANSTAYTTPISTAVSTVTTTVQQSSGSAAFGLANNTYIGTLMAKYKQMYIKDTACTPSVYNSTLITYAKQSPVGPLSFYNVSRQTPGNLNVSASGTASGYRLTYTTISPSETSTAVTMYITASGSIINVTYGGIFTGMNYSQLSSSYIFQSGIGNDCGAYIP